jgi:hypothetical protein
MVFAGYVFIQNNRIKAEYDMEAIRKLMAVLIESKKFDGEVGTSTSTRWRSASTPQRPTGRTRCCAPCASTAKIRWVR